MLNLNIQRSRSPSGAAYISQPPREATTQGPHSEKCLTTCDNPKGGFDATFPDRAKFRGRT